ncbi:hypothetical protein BH11CYA1_BH11CYA1_42850 [soil metagenome]
MRSETQSVSMSCNFTMLYIYHSLTTVPLANRFLSGALNFSSINDNYVIEQATENFNSNIDLASHRSLANLLALLLIYRCKSRCTDETK